MEYLKWLRGEIGGVFLATFLLSLPLITFTAGVLMERAIQQREAAKLGVGEYNKTTGEWQLKPPEMIRK